MGITAATASLIGAGIAAAGQVGSQGIANARNMRLARYSADFQREMIAQQNEYNSPVAQMARYKEAGLNPNLIYGQIGEGNQGEIPKYSAPEVRPLVTGNSSQLLADAVNQYMSMRLRAADLELRHQQLENMKEEQFRIRAERHSQDIENRYKSVLYGFDPGLVKMAGEDDNIRTSVGFRRYNQELQSLESLTSYRDAQKAYIDVQKQIAGLSRREKEYFVDNIQPLMRDILEKKSKGLDATNEILDVQKRFAEANQWVSYGKTLLDAVAKFINPLAALSGTGQNLSPYSGYPFDSTW